MGLRNNIDQLCMYRPPFIAKMLEWTSRPSPKIERLPSGHNFWSHIWNDPRAAQPHQPALHVSAAFQPNNAREDIATISQN